MPSKNATPKNDLISKAEKLHPHLMLLLLAFIGSGVLFLFMLLAFGISTPPADGRTVVPRFFVVSTVTLLMCSYLAQQLREAYDRDQGIRLKRVLLMLLCFGLVFGVFQLLGWQELADSGIKLSGAAAGSYLYVLSGLHLAHLIGGILFTGWQYVLVRRGVHDSVYGLMFFTSPYERTKMSMLAFVWHFLDGLWLVLFFYFLFKV
jgi:cytochrome c oxidase subunit 3